VIARKPRLEPDDLDGTGLRQDRLEEKLFNFCRTFAGYPESHDVCEVGPGLSCWKLLFKHQFLDALPYSEDVFLCTSLRSRPEDLLHIVCESTVVFKGEFSDKSGDIID
jgi:hypothetical protein